MTAKPPLSSSKWDDLKVRVISAVVMLVVGVSAILTGGVFFKALVVIVTAAMLWELWMMSAALRAKDSGAARQENIRFVVYGIGILIAGFGLIILRDGFGLLLLLWLISVVVVTDIAGYFAGRLVGGAKFWPSISPKKTWSGIVAGWAASAFVGFLFVVFANAGFGIVLVSIFVSFASQLGDIAESSLKRRAGVKDSSALIPGHGGVLDRFDGILGATVFALLIDVLVGLPGGLS